MLPLLQNPAGRAHQTLVLVLWVRASLYLALQSRDLVPGQQGIVASQNGLGWK